MKTEDYWLFSTAFFVAYGLFNILKLVVDTDYLVEIGFAALGFSFLLVGLVKYKMEKAETKQD